MPPGRRKPRIPYAFLADQNSEHGEVQQASRRVQAKADAVAEAVMFDQEGVRQSKLGGVLFGGAAEIIIGAVNVVEPAHVYNNATAVTVVAAGVAQIAASQSPTSIAGRRVRRGLTVAGVGAIGTGIGIAWTGAVNRDGAMFWEGVAGVTAGVADLSLARGLPHPRARGERSIAVNAQGSRNGNAGDLYKEYEKAFSYWPIERKRVGLDTGPRAVPIGAADEILDAAYDAALLKVKDKPIVERGVWR